MKVKITSIVSILIFIFFMGCSSDNGEPGNCGEILDVSYNVYSSTTAGFSIKAGRGTSGFKIEYGPAGFTRGTGTTMTSSNTLFDIEGLIPSTSYDVYVTGICEEVESSVFYKLTNVTTKQSSCPGDTELKFFQFKPNELVLQLLYGDATPFRYEIEYGLEGFSLGTGTRVSTTYLQKTITDIQMDTAYDFYVRTYCSPVETTPFAKYTYRTVVQCPKPTNLRSSPPNGACDSPNSIRTIGWNHQYESYQNFTVSLIRTMDEAPGSNTMTAGYNGAILYAPFCEWIGYYVKVNCSDGSSSEWAGPCYFF